VRACNKGPKLLSLSEETKSPHKTVDMLAAERKGGSVAIEGYNFQFWYAVYKILSYFANNVAKEEFIRLEGVEDVDVISTSTEFIQIKSSKNKFNAHDFWNEDVLQNFAEDFIDGQSRFRFVHNMDFADGHLSNLANACRRHEPPSSTTIDFWQQKFDEFKNEENAKG